MTTLHRLVLSWSGPQITGSAVSVLHWSGSDNSAPPVAAVLAAFNAQKTSFPSGVTMTVPNSGDSIDDSTGALTGVWSAAGGGAVGMTGLSACAAGVGACIGWTTGGIVIGKRGPRKLRGRTFLVPLQKDAYDGSGTLDQNTQTGLQTLANALQAAGPLAIWHRPSAAGASDGNSYGVISARVRDKVAYLSSRRD
jgi:hypothetical protein